MRQGTNVARLPARFPLLALVAGSIPACGTRQRASPGGGARASLSSRQREERMGWLIIPALYVAFILIGLILFPPEGRSK